MDNYRFSVRAQLDLDEIVDYSTREWGEGQAREYVSGLMVYIQRVADTPAIGRTVPLRRHGVMRYNYKAHSIFYKEEQGVVMIIRILAQVRDIRRHLRP